eukprot:gene5786-7197_t
MNNNKPPLNIFQNASNEVRRKSVLKTPGKYSGSSSTSSSSTSTTTTTPPLDNMNNNSNKPTTATTTTGIPSTRINPFSANGIVTPIKTSSSSTTLPNFMNENTPILSTTATPIRNRVMMSEVKPKVHRYPASPYTKKSTNDAGYDEDDDLDVDMMTTAGNESFISSASSKYFRNREMFNGSPESFYYGENNSGGGGNTYESSFDNSSTAAGSSSTTPAKKKKKSLSRKLHDIITYPIDKWDEFHEDILTFYNKPIYKTFIYEGNNFNSPNMSITQIVTPQESVDNVVVLDLWDPKFGSKTIFILFNPLNLYFLNEKYEGKVRDEKIVFGQLCQDYNHFMKYKTFTLDKGTQT